MLLRETHSPGTVRSVFPNLRLVIFDGRIYVFMPLLDRGRKARLFARYSANMPAYHDWHARSLTRPPTGPSSHSIIIL
jgi:hypothetical protein